MSILAVIMLSGCGTTLPRVETVIVETEVLKCPLNHRDISSGSRPALAIHSLTAEDYNDPGKVAQAFKASIKQLMAYSELNKQAFETYRNMCIGLEK